MDSRYTILGPAVLFKNYQANSSCWELEKWGSAGERRSNKKSGAVNEDNILDLVSC